MPGQLFNFSRYFKPASAPVGASAGKPASSSDSPVSPSSGQPATYNLQPSSSPASSPTIDMGKRVGMDVLSRLTARANTALMASVAKAKELKLQYIDTEHVLWGILHDSTIYQLISECKVTPRELQTALEKGFKPGNCTAQPHFSPRVKRVLELSLSAARSLGYEFISPEHILLALSQEGEGVAAQTLTQYNLKLEILTKKITGKKDMGGDEEKKKASALEQYAEDLTQKALEGKLDPVVGRSWEIERMIHILSRRTKNNPVLIGDAGVGKTAIVEGLALRISKGDAPETLLHKRILSLDLMSLIAGARHRGEFEERLKNLIKEVKATSGGIILFIDELHTMVGAGGGGEGSMDASNILKPSLARGELQTIGTTTVTEYRKYIEKDPALERRFQPILIAEPSPEVAIEMLSAIRDKYEAFHRVKISDEAIEAAVKLSQRYIGDRFLPDKAVDLIDEAAASVRLPAISLPEEIKSGEERLKKMTHEQEEAEKTGDTVHRENVVKEVENLTQSLGKLKEQYQIKKSTTTNSVSPEIIAEVVSRWTNIPISRLTESESTKLIALEDIIHKRLIDQEDAVSAVAEAVRRGRAGLKSNKRPIGSFIFMGPTGVGKTELAKALAEILFGSEEMIVRLDMTEYMEKHEVAKLIGAPPGYVGYEEGGQLTEAVRRRPYAVVLFDEIEKAHPDVFNILIQLLDDGRLTDNKGHTISFKNTIVICTSNLGSGIIQEELMKRNPIRQLADEIRSASWRTKSDIFKTYTISPTGRELITLGEAYWEKDAASDTWKKGNLSLYFAGSVITTGLSIEVSSGKKEFPTEDIDIHLIAPDGSETIIQDDNVWFRTSTTVREWTLTSLLSRMKEHTVVNALPDKPDQQLPTAYIDTDAISPSNVEIITLGDRFWRRENLQTKDWMTGLLSEYFQNSEKEELPFPTNKWDMHLFKPTGEEIIILGESYWQRKSPQETQWTTGEVKDLFSDKELPLGQRETEVAGEGDDQFLRLTEKLMEELRKFFKAELLNRFDEMIMFRPLTREHMSKIVDLQIKTLGKLLLEQNIALEISEGARTHLSDIGFDPVFGARPLRRTLQRYVENSISSLLIKRDITSGDTVHVDFDGKELTFNIKKMETIRNSNVKTQTSNLKSQSEEDQQIRPKDDQSFNSSPAAADPLANYFPQATGETPAQSQSSPSSDGSQPVKATSV